MSTLTNIQDQVIARLAEGQSVTSAAAELGLHRATIHHWKHTNLTFANALADAKEDALDHRRYLSSQHAPAALATLASLMNNPATPPSLRLKAALFLLNLSIGQPVKPARQPRHISTQSDTSTLSNTVVPVESPSATPQHSSQFITSDNKPAKVMNKLASYVRPTPKIGRNEKCPCGSTKKYKACCLGQAPKLAA